MKATIDLDRARVSQIARDTLASVAANYRAGPPSPERIFEALNALAFATATVIVGTGDRSGRREARMFFDRALENNVRDLVDNMPG